MPQYTVYKDGGEVKVNAQNLQSALNNVPGSTASQVRQTAAASKSSNPSANSGGMSAPQTASYNTVNGPKSPQQMASELQAVGWGGNPSDLASVVNAYSTTTRSSVTPTSGAWPGGGGGVPGSGTDGALGGGGSPDSANQWASSLLMQQAQNAANQAYLNARLNLDTDQLAFQKATQAFQNTISAAQQTGIYNGAPTQAAIRQQADIAAQQQATQLNQAQMFGTYGNPTQGQQTLQSQKQASDLQAQYAQMYGQYYAPGQMPTQGQQTLQGQQQGFQQGIDTAGLTGLYNGQQTQQAQQQAYNQWLQAQQQSLQQWQAQQGASQQYLQMMANLRGPADWAQYQKVLGATPGGTQDLVRAAAGQYIPGGGATTGVQPQAVSLGSFVNQATGGAAPANQQDQAAMQSLVAPNQMAPQTWNRLAPSQQQMLLGAWESQGYDKNDAQALFNQSLPRYAGSSPTSGGFRLQ